MRFHPIMFSTDGVKLISVLLAALAVDCRGVTGMARRLMLNGPRMLGQRAHRKLVWIIFVDFW